MRDELWHANCKIWQHGVMADETTETSTSGCGKLLLLSYLTSLSVSLNFDSFHQMDFIGPEWNRIINIIGLFFHFDRFSNPWNGCIITFNGWSKIWDGSFACSSKVMEHAEFSKSSWHYTGCSNWRLDWVFFWYWSWYVSVDRAPLRDLSPAIFLKLVTYTLFKCLLIPSLSFA